MAIYSLTRDNMINISLYFSNNYVDSELELKDKNVVVVDVLRTSTTMITGLANGAKEILADKKIIARSMLDKKIIAEATSENKGRGWQFLMAGEMLKS